MGNHKDTNDRLKERYTQAFSRLTASQEKIQEVIEMTENKKRRNIGRRILVGIAVAALLAVAAMGANAASGGELFARIVSYTVYDSAGEHTEAITFEVSDDGQGDVNDPVQFDLYQFGENGKAKMTYTDENGKQVTKEIDIDNVPTAMAPILRLEDKEGKTVMASAEGIELSEGNKSAVISYMDSGKECSVEIDIPDELRGYESIADMLVVGPISGTLKDGRSFTLTAMK